MEFYRQMLIHFFEVNHLALDILYLCEELDEQKTINFILNKIKDNVEEKEIIEYCKSQGMAEEQIDYCLGEIREGA